MLSPELAVSPMSYASVIDRFSKVCLCARSLSKMLTIWEVHRLRTVKKHVTVVVVLVIDMPQSPLA